VNQKLIAHAPEDTIIVTRATKICSSVSKNATVSWFGFGWWKEQ
jgi:hypothetical protein